MSSPFPKCGVCMRTLPKNLRDIKCSTCDRFFHIKHTNLKSKAEYFSMKLVKPWCCHFCVKPPKTKFEKCCECKKSISKPYCKVSCQKCSDSFHIKCSHKNKSSHWTCNRCLDSSLPFSNLNDNELFLCMQGKNVSNPDIFALPSFKIKSLLEKIPGNISIQTQEFLTNTITSKYYSPNDFITSKIPKNCFSIFHLNIASLEGHHDDLVSLLSVLDFNFDVIGITESKIRNGKPIKNINIDGYKYEFTPTETFFGGTTIYVRDVYEYEKRNEYSLSKEGVAESVFIELKSSNRKNVVIGCIYRHHCKISKFMDSFFEKLIRNVCIQEKNKVCVLMGDFNLDLLKTESDRDISDFYDFLSSFGFRPLILQPTRVTASTASLIDNIFINSLDTESKGGNLTTSISDHFSQFCVLDIFSKRKNIPSPCKQRNFKNFSYVEFGEELSLFDWPTLLSGKNSDDALKFFYDSIEGLLDEMAPYKTLNRKEQNLQQRPWITSDILNEMNIRDELHKKYLSENNNNFKSIFFSDYKKSVTLFYP